MIVATNQLPKNAIAVYLRRWEIENLFQGLKGRGFSFEDTYVYNQEHISKLLALLAVAFVWAHKIGEWHAIKKPILFKQFHDSRRPRYSFFRYGLNYIREALLFGKAKNNQLLQCVQAISLHAQLLKERCL